MPAPVLATLFTAVFRSGRVPREWLLGAITAIHKKNDTGDPNNDRGITVGHVLGKLYALMLNCRLTAWTEDSGVRATGQGGFRQGFQWVAISSVLTTASATQQPSHSSPFYA